MSHKLNCIMVIDDDEPTNFFTRIILEETGTAAHIKIMQSGQEALEYLSSNELASNHPDFPNPDLILLDINMPAMTGWEFLDEYKKFPKLQRNVIVMLTTSLFPEDKVKADRMPEISGFENKPVSGEKLALIVERYFSNEFAKEDSLQEKKADTMQPSLRYQEKYKN